MNRNEYPQIDFTDFQLDLDVSRRDLLKALGGGIVIFFCVGDSSILEAQQGSLPSDFNAFLRIGAEGPGARPASAASDRLSVQPPRRPGASCWNWPPSGSESPRTGSSWKTA
jgi:hypothetical protein